MRQVGYRILDAGEWNQGDETAAARAFAEEVLVGLSDSPKRLPSLYFYDRDGSALFQQITDLDDYYLTRSEFEIFREHGADLVAPFANRPINLVDLGAGDGRKTFVLIEALQAAGAQVRYVPIDISEDAMRVAVDRAAERFPELTIAGLVSEYFDGLRWLSSQADRLNLVLFLGSNIGNFDRPRARAFLRRLWNALNPDDRLLIGFDLKKDIERLLWAYNDRDGVTARFNLNLLHRINRELGGTFDVEQWRHFATYNVFSGAMESYLVSKVAQTVRIAALECEFRFAPWEPIHTEYSYKYLESDIEHLAEFAHFSTDARFYDRERSFCDALWRVEKR